MNIAIHTVGELYNFVLLYPGARRLMESTSLRIGYLCFPKARFPRYPFTQRVLDSELPGEQFGIEWYVNCLDFFCDHSCKAPETEEEFRSHSPHGFPCCADAEGLLVTWTGPETPKLVFCARWEMIFATAADRLRERRRNRAVRHQAC